MSADYIDLKTKDSLVTICHSNNIYDVNITNEDKIQITFVGEPFILGEDVLILKEVNEMSIVLDTIVFDEQTKYMEWFKKK